MSEKNISEIVKQMVAKHVEKSLDEITEDAKIVDDLGADSLEIMEMVMELEEEFEMDFDDDVDQFQTVSDVIKYIESNV